MVCCGELLMEDFVVRLRMERILVPNFLAGKGKKREEMAITVNWVTDGVDCCRVELGFCQVTEVFSKSDPSCVIHEKWHKNKGFAHATVISDGTKTKAAFGPYSKCTAYCGGDL